jgi:hypothetical protein
MNDFSTFPAAGEFAALWPLWLLLAILMGIYVLSEGMQQQTVRWMAMKRRDDLRRLEEERHRESVVK